MFVAEMTVSLFLEGCQSLKEKRGRLAGLRDRFGRLSNLAVCECGFQDLHQRSEWVFVAVATDKTIAQRTLQKVELFIIENLDAVITEIGTEYL